MSHAATKWAFDQPQIHRDMKPSEWAVLMVLADCHNPIYGCFPSQDYICDNTNLKERSVREQLNRLRERGLINWDAARENGKRGSNRYKLAFEDEFQPAENAGSSTGENVPEQPADSDSFNRQNMPPNHVRERVIEPVNEREGVRESAEEEKSETVSRETWRRRLKKAHKDWPTFADDSPEPTEKAWFSLSEAERDQAVALQGAYVHHVKTVLKRQAICRYSVYLKEKRWEKLPEKTVKGGGGRAFETAPPYGKLWGAVRFADLMLAPYGHIPPLSVTQEKLCADGTFDRASLLLERQANSGWPRVNTMHEDAVRRRRGVTADPALVQFGELFGEVAKGSGIWHAWKQLHKENGWPWLGPDSDCPDWIWMPVPPEDYDRYSSPLEAVRAAVDRFRTDYETIIERQAAE